MLPMGLISGDADKQAETCLDTAGGCRVVAEMQLIKRMASLGK
jgi:hypothetical protein